MNKLKFFVAIALIVGIGYALSPSQGHALEGGQGDDLSIDDVDPEELAMGIEVEMEHTNDAKIAEEIAMDHLSEDPEYYSKLMEFESGFSSEEDEE